MTLETTKKQFIIEKFYKEELKKGIIPTTTQIENKIKELENINNGNYLIPDTKQITTDISFGDNSSVLILNSIKTAFDNDVSILNKELFNIANQSRNFYFRWLNELKRLNYKAIELENDVDSLLLLTYDTYGYYGFVADLFTNLNYVDTDNTTNIDVNINEGIVTIDSELSSNDSSGGYLVNTNNFTDYNVSFSPITKREGTSYYTLGKNNSLLNITKDNNSMWAGKIVTKTSGLMISELKVLLDNDKDVDLSKVSIDFNSEYSTSSNVTLQYSIDGYSWNLIPSRQATKSLNSRLSWTFPLTAVRWLKFIFYKDSPDNENNEYYYSCSNLKVFGNIYNSSTIEDNVLITKGLFARNNKNEIIKFYKASLETCEEIPTDTSIYYYLAMSKDNSTWSDWFPITPFNRNEINYPKVININGAILTDNNSEENTTKLYTSVTEDGVSQKKITTEFDTDTYIGYRFKNQSFGVVNTAISVNTNEDIDIISNSIVVWRNTRNTSEVYDTALVRNTLRGWGNNGNEYSCYFEVINPDGIIIDFGDTKSILDDNEISGIVNIPEGIHKFSTTSEYWYDVSQNTTSSTVITTEESFKSIDPLYPYNHKLLIEGYNYTDLFKGTKIYSGTNISAEFYCKRTSLFDLENNTDNLNKFAIRNVGSESNPTLAVILYYDINSSDYTNELSTIKWKAGDANSDMYQYIKLKAIFNTNNTSISPVLSSYRIKLGI